MGGGEINMVMWSHERILKFREQLIKEFKCPSLWYYPTKGDIKDKIVRHPECPYGDKRGDIAEHRYIWWLHHQNEPIKYNEIIHHINGDHNDNRIENLEKVKYKEHYAKHQQLNKLNKLD